MTQLKQLLMLMLVVLLTLTACRDTRQQAAQAPTATLALIVSMTPRFTATPVATRTPLPSATYTPSVTLTPSDTPVPPTPTEPPPLIGIIASSQSVNVREGPGLSFRAIDALTPGTGVEVLGQSEDADWYNILMASGDEGWISAALVRLQATPTLPPTLTPTVDETARALGTVYPTALLGGAPVTPTLPNSVLALTTSPGAATTEDPLAPTPTPTANNAAGGVVDAASINQTATALALSVVDASAALTQAAERPVGGPTGGPSNPGSGPTPSGGLAQVSAAETAADILAYCDNPFIGSPPPRDLQAGEYIRVWWSWFARTREQINEHNNAVLYDVRVNGVPLSNWRQYALDVRQQDDGNYYQYWYVPFGPLEAGRYEITYTVTWREAISDGYASFGPGTGTPQESGSCVFTVGE